MNFENIIITDLVNLNSSEKFSKSNSGVQLGVCFGLFRGFHYGHIEFLRFASQHCDYVLVVVQQSGSLSYDEKNRLLNSLDQVEVNLFVYLSDDSGEEIYSVISPDILFLGPEHQSGDESRCELKGKLGCGVPLDGARIIFAPPSPRKSVLFDDESRVRRLTKGATIWQLELAQDCLKKCQDAIAAGCRPRVLVVGDVIVDEFCITEPVGMSSESPTIVVKEIEKKRFLGGAGIVAANLAAMGCVTSFASVVGIDEEAVFVRNCLSEFSVIPLLVEDPDRFTSRKTRYVAEQHSLLRLSRLDEFPLGPKIESDLMCLIGSEREFDAVVISSFGYGVINDGVMRMVVELAKSSKALLVGDAQVSSQLNSLSKFIDFDVITPTEKEARITTQNFDGSVEAVSNQLIDQLDPKVLVLKLGKEGFITYSKSQDKKSKRYYEALQANPVDLAGAGDSLLAAITSGLVLGSDIESACALGSVCAAISISHRGNRPISLAEVSQYIIDREGMGG